LRIPHFFGVAEAANYDTLAAFFHQNKLYITPGQNKNRNNSSGLGPHGNREK
jgi:hypothetical protein